MITNEHISHKLSRVSHSDCCECRADTERQFVDTRPWQYEYVADYLKWAKPRIEAIRSGVDSVDSRTWLRKFRQALHARISLKTAYSQARRKYCDSYLERLANIRRSGLDGFYLRRYAQRRASCLDQ